MGKQVFKNAYSAARQAAAGRRIESFPGQSAEMMGYETAWSVAYQAACAGVYVNGAGSAMASRAAKAAVRTLMTRAPADSKSLAQRLDVFRRERAGEWTDLDAYSYQ